MNNPIRHDGRQRFAVCRQNNCQYPFRGGGIWTAKPKVITAIAMFYDLEDPNKFCADVKQILHEDGVFIIQMNYLGTMIENLTLDNISHEHRCYYSFASLSRILEANGLQTQSITFNDVNGGSMRVVCGHKQGLVKHMANSMSLKESHPRVELE